MSLREWVWGGRVTQELNYSNFPPCALGSTGQRTKADGKEVISATGQGALGERLPKAGGLLSAVMPTPSPHLGVRGCLKQAAKHAGSIIQHYANITRNYAIFVELYLITFL